MDEVLATVNKPYRKKDRFSNFSFHFDLHLLIDCLLLALASFMFDCIQSFSNFVIFYRLYVPSDETSKHSF